MVGHYAEEKTKGQMLLPSVNFGRWNTLELYYFGEDNWKQWIEIVRKLILAKYWEKLPNNEQFNSGSWKMMASTSLDILKKKLRRYPTAVVADSMLNRELELIISN